MEKTGGGPDVVRHIKNIGAFNFMDRSEESPKGRRSTCYYSEGLESRKDHQPADNAMDLAAEMGIAMLTEEVIGTCKSPAGSDLKSSNWY